MVKIDPNVKKAIILEPYRPKINHSENEYYSGPATINLTKKIPQKEIQEILKKIGTLKVSPFEFPSRYTIQFLPKFEDVVINNVSKTNDTTIIAKDGSVRNCGSWHDKEIAPEGSFPEIVEDVKKYIEGPKILRYDVNDILKKHSDHNDLK